MKPLIDLEKTVFIVDDDPAVATALSRLLTASGYTTSVFNSAREFMHQYKPGRGACLLADFSMPDMTGLDLQRWLSTLGVPMPVIFLTALDDIPDHIRVAMHAVAVDVLTKPVRATTLIAAIEKALATPGRIPNPTATLPDRRFGL